MVTMENAEEYVELMFDLCMHTGIQKQMEAFRGKRHVTSRRGDGLPQCVDLLFACLSSFSEGFNRVFQMEKMSSFSHKEVQMILCGNQSPSWTADDIINYTEPKLGYTRDRY